MMRQSEVVFVSFENRKKDAFGFVYIRFGENLIQKTKYYNRLRSWDWIPT